MIVDGQVAQIDSGASTDLGTVLGALGSAIALVAPVQATVTGTGASRVLTLTAIADNTPFTIDLATADAKGTVNDSAYATPTQTAATGAPQVNTIQLYGSFDTSAVYKVTLSSPTLASTTYQVYGSALTPADAGTAALATTTTAATTATEIGNRANSSKLAARFFSKGTRLHHPTLAYQKRTNPVPFCCRAA